MTRTLLVALALFAALAPPAAASLGVQPPSRPTPAQLAGQRVVFAFDGTSPPRALLRRIARGEAGGVVLFSRNIRSRAQLARLVRRLQGVRRAFAPDEPLLVMVDQEGGSVRRVPGPPRRSASQVRSAGEALADGRAAGRLLASVGVNVDLAPVADVGRRGSAIERERRSYGRSPRRVAAFAGAFAAGLDQSGVAATAKHFPGFGAAGANTDFSAVRIRRSRAELRRVDEAPFAALIRDGVPMVMLSNAVYPAFDSRPAGLSRTLATSELRGRLGFRGVSVTDDLEATATASLGPERLALTGARAGVDLLLFAQSYASGERAAAALERSLRAGRLPRAAAERSLARVLALRRAVTTPR